MFFKINIQYLWDIKTLKTAIKLWEIFNVQISGMEEHVISTYMRVKENMNALTIQKSLIAR